MKTRFFRYIILSFVAALSLSLTLSECNLSKSDENSDDTAQQLFLFGLGIGTYSCEMTATSSQCINMYQVDSITSTTLCSQLGGILSAKDVKCGSANNLGACLVSSADSVYITGSQSLEVVYYSSAAGGANAQANATTAETFCTDANNPLKGTFSTTYTP